MQRTAVALGILVLASALTACAQAELPDTTDRVTTADLPGALPTVKFIIDEPYQEITGTVAVVDGCVVIEDPDSGVGRLAIWPLGTRTSTSDGPTIVLPNGSVPLGDDVGPSKGHTMTRTAWESYVADTEASTVEDLDSCDADFENVVILSYVKDFGQQE